MLEQLVFAHGPLYVALSRAETPENVKVYLGGRIAKDTCNGISKEVLHASQRAYIA